MPERDAMTKQNMYSNFIVSRQSWREGVRAFAFSTSLSCRGIQKTKPKKIKQEKINILSYQPLEIEKNNCLGRTELARGKTLKSCEIFLKAIFLAEWVECAINVWIVDHGYFQKLANAF